MSSSQTIALYFGDASSHIGAHHWNIQHNLLNCAEENDYLDTDQIFIEKKSNQLSPMALFFNLSAHEYSWNKMSKFRYSEKSFCKVPLWKSSQPFDVCFQGARIKGGDFEPVISKDVWEDVFIENFRHMAEQCDYLKHISITADCFDAFGGVTSSYVEQLVDEMLSPSVAMSFVCLTMPVAEPIVSANSEYFSAKQADSLTRLNVPYTLATLTGLSPNCIVLPLDLSGVAAQVREQIQRQRQCERLLMAQQGELDTFERLLPDDEAVEQHVLYRSTLFAASSLEMATGCLRLAPAKASAAGSNNDRRGGQSDYDDFAEQEDDESEDGAYEPNAEDTMDVREWLGKATGNGRYPVCNLEVNLPHSYSICPPSALGGSSSLLQHIQESFSIFDGGQGASNDTRMSHESQSANAKKTRVYDYQYLNPGMNVQLASAIMHAKGTRAHTHPDGGDEDAGDAEDNSSAFRLDSRRVERPFSNMLSVRGCVAPELHAALFSKCINSNYMVNDIGMRRAAIPMDRKESVGILSCMLSRQLAESAQARINIDSLVDTIWSSTGNTLNSFLYCSGVGAIGADKTIEQYLSHLCGTWSQSTQGGVYRDASSHSGESMRLAQQDYQGSSSQHTAFQLAKYGFGREDSVHVSEVLTTLRLKYSDQGMYNM